MKSIILSTVTLPILLFGLPCLAEDASDEPAHTAEPADAAESEEVLISLEVPLSSPLFSETPIAVVEDDVITVGELMGTLSATHAGRSQEGSSRKKDYASLLDRIITTRLIVHEARAIGFDELPAIRSEISSYSTQLLISTVMSRHLLDVEPDAAEVDKLYRTMSRELLLETLKFAKESDALAFQERQKSGEDFQKSAEAFIEERRAEGQLGGQEYVRLKDMLPAVAQSAFAMEVGSVSEIFTAQGGFLLFRVVDARFYEDPSLRAEARAKVLEPLRKQKGNEYGELLEQRHATVDEALFEEVSFEAKKVGFLWFKKEKPVDYEKLLLDERVLATVHDEEPLIITVADLAKELQSKFYHGVDNSLEGKKDLDKKKRITLKNMVFKRAAQLEARAQGIDESVGYLAAVDEHTNSLLFGAFIKKVVAPDVKISEEEVRQHFEEHLGEFSTPKMVRLRGLAFHTLEDAERAMKKMRRGADFSWVSANSRGQVNKDAKGLLVFDDKLLTVPAVPEGLREKAKKAKQGDSLLYSDPDGFHYAISVTRVFAATPKPYESAREEIGKEIMGEKVRELVADWGSQLREGYETRVFLSALPE